MSKKKRIEKLREFPSYANIDAALKSEYTEYDGGDQWSKQVGLHGT